MTNEQKSNDSAGPDIAAGVAAGGGALLGIWVQGAFLPSSWSPFGAAIGAAVFAWVGPESTWRLQSLAKKTPHVKPPARAKFSN